MSGKNSNRWIPYPDTIPPDIPENEDFGVEYEILYKLPTGETEMTITEWLWEKKWNCIYPVVAWRVYNNIISREAIRDEIKKGS